MRDEVRGKKSELIEEREKGGSVKGSVKIGFREKEI